MKKYIDADAAINAIRGVIAYAIIEANETLHFIHGPTVADAVDKALEALPAADVAEVVHGEWLNFVGDYVTAECSACGECYDPSDFNDKEHFDMFKQLYKYCPNCGAKMDGEKEGV